MYCVDVSRGDEDLNRANQGGWTPLMYACYIGHVNVVNLLLQARVTVNITNKKQQTPLILAASCGNEEVAGALLKVHNAVMPTVLYLQSVFSISYAFCVGLLKICSLMVPRICMLEFPLDSIPDFDSFYL